MDQSDADTHIYEIPPLRRGFLRYAGGLCADITALALVHFLFRQIHVPAPMVFYSIRDGAAHSTQIPGLDWFVLLAAGMIGVLHISGFYRQRLPFWEEARALVKASLITALCDLLVLLMSGHQASIVLLLVGWALVIASLFLCRYAVRRVLWALGYWQMPVVIIGDGENLVETVRALNSEQQLGYNISLAICVGDGGAAVAPKLGVPCYLVDDDQVAAFVSRQQSLHAVVALEQVQAPKFRSLLIELGQHPHILEIIPPLAGVPLYGTDLVYLFGREVVMLRTRNNLERRFPRIFKRIFDIVAVTILVVLLSPLLAYLAWRIRRESGSPVFYVQDRVGRGGRLFPCMKFRSMVHDAEAVLARWQQENPLIYQEYLRTKKLRDDPRVTPIGRIIRAYSLDELPQLFNVLRGEMSLVGPRPILEREKAEYGLGIVNYQRVAPGLTGLWQISGRSETSFQDRADYDDWYIKNWSIWFDLVILVRTISVVFGRCGAY